MGVRETLNKKPGLVTGLTIGIVAVVAVVLFVQNRKPHAGAPTRAFFTTDDGATLFDDSADQVAPFDHDGRQAVQARVFSCDGGKTRFVGFLERTPDKAKAAAAPAAPPQQGGRDLRPILSVIRAPNAPSAKWVPKNSPEGAAITGAIKCPDGGDAQPVEVFPK